MKHEDYKEMLAAAALDALDAAERRTLDAHLATCAGCRIELEELRAVTALLVYQDVPVAPPAELRARLLAQLKSTPQTPRVGGGALIPANGAPVGDTTGAATPVTATNVLPFAPAPRMLFGARPRVVFATLAASIIIAALASTLAVLWAQNRRMQTDLARLTQNLHETQQTLVSVRADRELLAALDTHTTALAGTDVANGARARITYDERTGRAVFVIAGLPAPPPGKAYQLWFIADGKPLPGHVFNTDTSGRAEVREQIPPQGRHAQIFAVTLEPQAGVSAPTGQIYLKGTT